MKPDWSSGSPPLIVTPPPAALMKVRYFSISAITSSTVADLPSRMCQVSGFWQYRQRSGQPLVNSTNRVPGPSTPVETSQEWIRPLRCPSLPGRADAWPGTDAGQAPFTAGRGRCG